MDEILLEAMREMNGMFESGFWNQKVSLAVCGCDLKLYFFTLNYEFLLMLHGAYASTDLGRSILVFPWGYFAC